MGAQWREKYDLAPDMDLDTLVIALNRRSIDHEIRRENNTTSLWIKDTTHADSVIEIIDQIQRVTNIRNTQAAIRPSADLVVRAYLKRIPITIGALLLCILGAVLVEFYSDLVSLFTFQNFIISSDRNISFEPLSMALQRNEWWRLITPAFLHFGLFHIVFNGLWLWEFGRRVELLVGSGAYLILLSALAIGANVGQYLWDGPALFGGFSGVVYGLLGYIWVRSKRIPHPLLMLPQSIFPLMIGWLLICLLGVVDLMIQGGVANGAHVSGLLIGMIFGAFAGQREPEQD